MGRVDCRYIYVILVLLLINKAYSESLVFFGFYGINNYKKSPNRPLISLQRSFSKKKVVHGYEDVQITLPCEAAGYLTGKDYNLDPNVVSPLGNRGLGAEIIYEPNMGNLTEGDMLHFKLHNAKFSKALTKCWLVFYEHKGVDINGDGIGDIGFDVNGDGDSRDSFVIAESVGSIKDASEITFRVTNNGASFPSNGLLYLACSENNEKPISDQNISDYGYARFNDKYNPVIVLDNLYNSNKHTNLCPDRINKIEGKKVCLTITANACCPNTSMKLPDLSVETPQCFIDMKCQFSLNIKPSLSIIDMYALSKTAKKGCDYTQDGIFKCYDPDTQAGIYFLDEGSGNVLSSESCTDNDVSSSTITIINDNDHEIDDYIKLGSHYWKAKFDVKLYDTRIGSEGKRNNGYACDDINGYGTNLGAYTALDFNNHRVFIDNSSYNATPSPDQSAGDNDNRLEFKKGKVCTLKNDVYIEDSGFPTSNKIVIPHGHSWTEDVYIGVTGKNRLYWIKWGLKESLSFYDNDGVYRFTLSMDENANCFRKKCCYENDGNAYYFIKWEPNGDEIYIPHLLNNYLTYIKIANNSCWDTEVYARVWDENGHFVDNVYIGVVPAHGGKILWGADLFKRAKVLNPYIGKGGGTGTFSSILTVGAPKRDIEVAVGDSRDGKGKMLPANDLKENVIFYRNERLDSDAF